MNKHNNNCLNQLDNAIALVRALHTNKAKDYGSDKFLGLETELFVAVGARVVLTINIFVKGGLNNGATGFVKDIFYAKGKNLRHYPC